MFAVIYRSYVHQDMESTYQILWRKIANYFVKERGALGSFLNKTDDGYWLAYSCWPDKTTRDAAWPGEGEPSQELPTDIQQAIIQIKACLDPERKFPEICMTVVDDVMQAPISFS